MGRGKDAQQPQGLERHKGTRGHAPCGGLGFLEKTSNTEFRQRRRAAALLAAGERTRPGASAPTDQTPVALRGGCTKPRAGVA